MIGKTLGHYQITEKLGEGGMGVVYKARDTHLDRFVALKVLPPEKVADPDRKRRFVQEAKAASALNHPNIVTIHDIAQAEGIDFIVMEYVPGKTLDQLIPRRGMRLNEALKHAVQIADALARAHGAGIIHRDLKPSNVMVDEHGLVKVLDFGLAKLTETGPVGGDTSTRTAEATTEKGTIVGTVTYMSPEQAEGKPVDARSDIFSFGAVLYEMVTGKSAFKGDSKMSTLSAILHKEPAPLGEETPHDLCKLISRALRKDPERRFQNMADVKVALAELRDESDSATAAGPQAARARKIMRKRVAIPLILSLVIAVAWVLWRRIGGEVQPPIVTQLTTYAGSEGSPSFSPDGNQVAFAWNGEKGNNWDIYIKMVGEVNALRLTTDPGNDGLPAWSPDGKRIAFMRATQGGGGIYLISPLGGVEQKLANFLGTGQMSWSPDGKFLAIARGANRASSLVLLPAGGGEPRPISTPAAPGWDWCPAFSPDGRQLAYAQCSGSSMCDLYIQELGPDGALSGDRRRITREEIYINGLTWSRDGKSLIFGASVGHGVVTYLRRVDAKGTSPSARIELAGRRVAAPAIAPTGNRMAFVRLQGNLDIWRYTPGGVAEPFLKSSMIEWHPRFSRDGKKVVFTSDRGGETFEVWVANADGSNPVPVTNRVGLFLGSPDWSPDGRWIAFDCQSKEGPWKVWVVEASGAGLRCVTSGQSDDVIPTWSRDGKLIYFRSNRTGRNEIWRAAISGGQPEQITTAGGDDAFESFDGKTLFYSKRQYEKGSPIFEMPLAERRERQIIDYVHARAFAVVEDGIYYIGRRGEDQRYPVLFYKFSSRTAREITRLEGVSEYWLTVSPDRKSFLFTRSVATGSDLMLVENFR